MQKTICGLLSIVLFGSAFSVNAEKNLKETKMSATGTFEVKLEPQDDSDAPAGRMIIRKKYSGDLLGSGLGQMLSKRTKSGGAAYSAVEEFSGSVAGKNGSFTLIHNGFMSPQTQKLEVYVLQGSGTGDLANISGTLDITQKGGVHKYIFNYEL